MSGLVIIRTRAQGLPRQSAQPTESVTHHASGPIPRIASATSKAGDPCSAEASTPRIAQPSEAAKSSSAQASAVSSNTSNTQSRTASSVPEVDAHRESGSLRKTFKVLGDSLADFFCQNRYQDSLLVTLTFAEDISPLIARARLNSLNNAIRQRYGGYLWVLQLQRSGRIHYHLIVPAGFDCHDGTMLEEWSANHQHPDPRKRNPRQQRRAAMNPQLRAESDWWDAKAPLYGFGRVEVAPIYSSGETITKYLLNRPTPAQMATLPKGTRFWGCSKHLKIGTVNFSWVSPGARRGRQRLANWAAQYGCFTREEIRKHFGPRWGYFYLCDMEHERRLAALDGDLLVTEPIIVRARASLSNTSSELPNAPAAMSNPNPCEGPGRLRPGAFAPVPNKLSGHGVHRTETGAVLTERSEGQHEKPPFRSDSRDCDSDSRTPPVPTYTTRQDDGPGGAGDPGHQGLVAPPEQHR